MTDIGRIADKQGWTVDLRQVHGAVVGKVKGQPVAHVERGSIGAQHECGERVDFDGDQLGVGGQLSTGVIVVLGIRIFSNVAAIRRHLFHA